MLPFRIPLVKIHFPLISGGYTMVSDHARIESDDEDEYIDVDDSHPQKM